MTSCCISMASLKATALRWPWILFIVALYAFALPWMASSIVYRYFISRDYDSTLPGLDATPARKFYISAHMGLGLICLVLYPFQFVQRIRKNVPSFHRWSGRVSLLSAVFVSFCGIIFICLKKFQLVGGVNMGIAFFSYGITLGTCAVMTLVYARKKEFVRHKNWAIRSFSQILATMFYRYCYLLLGGMRVRDNENKHCDENDVCDLFLGAFDMIHAWTFFIFPLLFAELLIFLLRSPTNDVNTRAPAGTTMDGDRMIDSEVAIPVIDENQTKYGALDRLEEQQDVSLVNDKFLNSFLLNLFGIFAAIICLGSTVLIFVTSALGLNTITA